MTASLLAGVMNAMAGGGSFLSFPAMLGMGIPPIEANATNTVALWPGQLTSLATLHGDVRRSLLPVVVGTAIVGSIVGAEVLLHTRQGTFLRLLPWLLLFGAVTFWVSGPISTWMKRRSLKDAVGHVGERPMNYLWLTVAMLPICFYIGYFGAGGGFLVMTVLALFGMEDMHQLNAMKVVTAAVSNVTAITIFIISKRVVWHDCLVAMLFAGLGGYVGARYAKRMNPGVLRAVVVVTGLAISGYFFWREHQV